MTNCNCHQEPAKTVSFWKFMGVWMGALMGMELATAYLDKQIAEQEQARRAELDAIINPPLTFQDRMNEIKVQDFIPFARERINIVCPWALPDDSIRAEKVIYYLAKFFALQYRTPMEKIPNEVLEGLVIQQSRTQKRWDEGDLTGSGKIFRRK